VPDEVSNRLITQVHALVRLPMKLENPESLARKLIRTAEQLSPEAEYLQKTLVLNNTHIEYCLYCYKYQSKEYKYITLYNYTCLKTQFKVQEIQ